MVKRIIRFACTFICLMIIMHGSGQTQVPKLRVFLDCHQCDNPYIKTEITVVDFVVDRMAADVHILVTAQETGGGGQTYQLIFFGQNKYSNRRDTLNGQIADNSTEIERRTELTKRIKLGLVPFLMNSRYADMIEINMKGGKDTSGNIQQTKDKWNYWVYRIGSDASYSEDEIYKSGRISGNLSANRTTEKTKINFSIYGNYSTSSYEYETNGVTSKLKVDNNDYAADHTLIAAINGQWSAGYEIAYSSSTFSNNKSRKYLAAGIEYAIFPYKFSNTKYLTVSYQLEMKHNIYYDTTIFNKLRELLPGHKVEATLSLRQKWGTINSKLTYSNYLKDWKLNNLWLYFDVNLRITGGLSFYMYSQGGLVRDQIYLQKGNATEQEILTRKRQLASGYNFYSGVGLSFRFGSILNNFVNPRFGL